VRAPEQALPLTADISEPQWRPAGKPASLAGDEIHLWRVSLDQPPIRLAEAWKALSSDERQRAESFRFDCDRDRFVIGRGVLRDLIGRYRDVAPGSLEFSYGRYGKPALAGEECCTGLAFNLAHSGPMALYAFTRGRPIGVDIEQLRPLPDAEDLAARFLTAAEGAVIRVLPPEQRTLAFHLAWTLCEACAKASGGGLGRHSGRADSTLLPAEPALDAPPAWTLTTFRPLPGYVAAVAVAGQTERMACWDHEWWTDPSIADYVAVQGAEAAAIPSVDGSTSSHRETD
jgi:4'-phosphopantetheinyl transferase